MSFWLYLQTKYIHHYSESFSNSETDVIQVIVRANRHKSHILSCEKASATRKLNTVYLTVNKSNVTTINSSKEDSAELYKIESFFKALFLLSVTHHYKKNHRDHEKVIHFIKKSKKLHNKAKQSIVR